MRLAIEAMPMVLGLGVFFSFLALAIRRVMVTR
jgi:hypothetical protein